MRSLRKIYSKLNSLVRTPQSAVKPRLPRILLLPDKRGWSFDICARALAKYLDKDFEFTIRYTADKHAFEADLFDLVYVFFWGEQLYKIMSIKSDRLIKRLASHRWEDDPRYGPCTPRELVSRYLRDATAVHCTSKRLRDAVCEFHPHTFQLTNGYDPAQFHKMRERHGPLNVGWAGNSADRVKGVEDILRPACQDQFKLRVAPGNLSHRQMNAFYNEIDVIAVTSLHEGQPMPLIEAMAAGCFPVATDVGIVPDVVRHEENGLIVAERTPEAFRKAFQWCDKHLRRVREAGKKNADEILNDFGWAVAAPKYKAMFLEVLARSREPRFRNDDVSWDTPLNRFEDFCRIFWGHNYVQVHGVTLRGRVCSFARSGAEAAPYEGVPPLSRLENSEIRALSEPYRFEERTDLIQFLANSPDEIALHGLYHSDYSTMTESELAADISAGLQLLEHLLPNKLVRYFVAPFNRTSPLLYAICRQFNLEVLAKKGIHFEQHIENVVIEPGTWYRYHHHRFYPESTCSFYPTTLETLRAALARKRAK